MNYLIVSPVRSGSTWLNLTLAKHLNLTNIGEALCKISPTLLMNSNINLTSQLANNNTDLPENNKRKKQKTRFFSKKHYLPGSSPQIALCNCV